MPANLVVSVPSSKCTNGFQILSVRLASTGYVYDDFRHRDVPLVGLLSLFTLIPVVTYSVCTYTPVLIFSCFPSQRGRPRNQISDDDRFIRLWPQYARLGRRCSQLARLSELTWRAFIEMTLMSIVSKIIVT